MGMIAKEVQGIESGHVLPAEGEVNEKHSQGQ